MADSQENTRPRKRYTNFIVPTHEEWRDSYEVFRNSLHDLYATGKFRHAADFCKAHNLSRAQFSRVIRGHDKPSPSMVEKLAESFPEAYKDESQKWLGKRSRGSVSPDLIRHYETLLEQQRRLIDLLTRNLEEKSEK